MRFFFYSHDGMGLGHVRRHIAIASALHEAAPEIQILLATSVDEVARLGLPPNVDTLKLPGLRKVGNTQYTSRKLGIPSGEMRNLRSAILCEAVREFRPGVVLVDKHPLGAAGEMVPALKIAKTSGARLVLGLRDILDDPAAVIEEWARDRLNERICDYYDLALVYGIRSVFDPVQQYSLPIELAARTRYCGYVVNHALCTWCNDGCPHLNVPEPVTHPTVLCTVGGGEDGFFLLKSFLQASNNAPWKGIIVTGPMLPENELKVIRQMATDSGAVVQPFAPCLSNLFWTVDALVCMGGYNTLLEALSQGVPTVCVPRVAPRSEQRMRASAFQDMGLLRMITPDMVSPEGLKKEISTALAMKRTDLVEKANEMLNFDGAHASASYLLTLLADRYPYHRFNVSKPKSTSAKTIVAEHV
jgi:predicted glycosyltransferase